MCVYRCEPLGGNREWSDAVGPQRSGKGLPSDQPKALPADGRPGGTQRLGHYIRYNLMVEFLDHINIYSSIVIYKYMYTYTPSQFKSQFCFPILCV